MHNLNSADYTTMPKHIRFFRTAVPLATIALLLLPITDISEGSDRDSLIFAVHDYSEWEIPYATYDPVDKVKQPVYTAAGPGWFNVSTNGRVAVASQPEDKSDIHIIDLRRPEATRIHIAPHPTTLTYPLAWSHDGSSLAFVSASDEGEQKIDIWDGRITVNITPDGLPPWVDSYQASWSVDGQLAFVIWYQADDSHGDKVSEIYRWDGDTITNLSQNQAVSYSDLKWSLDGRLAFVAGYIPLPDSDPGEIFLWNGSTTSNPSQNSASNDHAPAWSANGQLAFRSVQDDETDIFVWDGVSTMNGAPDADTFVNVAQDLTAYFSEPVWTTRNQLAFEGVGPKDNGHVQIYVWDSVICSSG